MPLVLFNPSFGPYQVLPRRARVDLGAMTIKGCSAFIKAPALLEPQHQIVYGHIEDTHWRGSYPSAEVQSVYYRLGKKKTDNIRLMFLRTYFNFQLKQINGFESFETIYSIFTWNLRKVYYK